VRDRQQPLGHLAGIAAQHPYVAPSARDLTAARFDYQLDFPGTRSTRAAD